MENTLQIEVEELASLQFSKDEILTIVGEDKKLEEIWIKRGRLKAEAEVRKSILSQAKQGSSPAQKEYMNMIKNLSEDKKIDYELLKNDVVRIIFDEVDKSDPVIIEQFEKLKSLVVKYV